MLDFSEISDLLSNCLIVRYIDISSICVYLTLYSQGYIVQYSGKMHDTDMNGNTAIPTTIVRYCTGKCQLNASEKEGWCYVGQWYFKSYWPLSIFMRLRREKSLSNKTQWQTQPHTLCSHIYQHSPAQMVIWIVTVM